MAVETKPMLLRATEAARELGISRAYLYELTARGDGPPFIRLGRGVRFPTDQLQDWIRTKQEREF